MINGSFWVGATLGALVAVALLNPSLVDPELGWRLAFLTGAANARIDEPLLDCRNRRLPFPSRPWIASQRLLQYFGARFAQGGRTADLNPVFRRAQGGS